MRKLVSVMLFTLLLSLFAGSALGASEAKVRIVHASPDAPAVDITVDGQTVVTNAAFKAATSYLTVGAGEHEVKIFAAGTVAQGNAVLTRKLTVEAGKSYTVAAANKLANLELVVMNDDTTVTTGKAKVRVAHLSPDAPAVDVAVKGGDVLFANAPFKGVTNYAEVSPATLNLEVRPTGTKDVVLDLPNTALKANTVYTVLAVGLASGEPKLGVMVLADPVTPNGLPKTGYGGMSNLYTALAAIAVAGAAIVLFRKGKSHSA